jgi:tetratricopeptide (TPR) repeat protein
MATFWDAGGYFTEGRRWLETCVERAGGERSIAMAGCLNWLRDLCEITGDLARAATVAVAALEMARSLADPDSLALALQGAARLESYDGRHQAAESMFEEALGLASEGVDRSTLYLVLSNYAGVVAASGDLDRSLSLETRALALAREQGDRYAVLSSEHSIACDLRLLGRPDEAERTMHALVEGMLELNDPNHLIVFAEDYGAVLAELGQHAQALRMLGAAEAMRERLSVARLPYQEAEIAVPFARARGALPAQDADEALRAGRATAVEDVLLSAPAPTPGGTR